MRVWTYVIYVLYDDTNLGELCEGVGWESHTVVFVFDVDLLSAETLSEFLMCRIGDTSFTTWSARRPRALRWWARVQN